MSDEIAKQGSHDGSLKPVRVSVVVPVYRRSAKAIACVQSLLRQSLRDAEVIVIDDGSHDGTREALELLALSIADATRREDHISLTILHNEQNVGANISRNRGIRAARGSLIAFTDSDCVADPRWLEELVQPFIASNVGAVTGLVEDRASHNMWELAFRGTHRLPHAGPVGRIVIGNLCVRRKILLAHCLDESRPTRRTQDGTPDLTVSARSDEEGLNLALRAAGWTVLAQPTARVDHDHTYSRQALLKQAWFGGMSACDIVWKYRLGPRKDLGPILLFHVALWLSVFAMLLVPSDWRAWILVVPALIACLPIAAISYNELWNKGKTPLELLCAAPALTVYYHIRLAGYLMRRIEIARHIRRPERVDIAQLAENLPRPPSRRCAQECPEP